MKILVTGCCGFVGGAVSAWLEKQGEKVYCLDLENNCSSPRHLACDLKFAPGFELFPAKLDAVVHCAATMNRHLKPWEIIAVNTFSTYHLLELGRKTGIKKFIYLSTGGVYGYGEEPCREASPALPTDPYSLSKYQGEILTGQFAEFFNTASLRLFFPYGRGQKRGIFPLFIDKIKNRQPITLNNELGSPRTNPMAIGDLLEVIGLALKSDNPSLTLNAGGKEAVTIKQIAEMLGEKLQIPPLFEVQENPGVSNLLGDISGLKTRLGFVPQISLEQGLEEMLH